MRVGLLLGSFDPIHIGHVHMATEALNRDLVDQVFFVPTMQNPWKEHKATDFGIRCSMIREAIAPVKKCFLCTIEAQLRPPYYSSTTLRAILRDFPEADFYLIVGTDTAVHIDNWYEGDWISKNFKFITVTRPDFDDTAIVDIDKSIDVSSSNIRKMVKEGKIIYPLVTEKVNNYIQNLNLYK